MGALEDIAAALLGSDTQKVIAAENPYYQFEAVPQAINTTLAPYMKVTQLDDGRLVTPVDQGEVMPWGIGAGIAQGLLAALGDDYQNTLSQRYIKAATGRDAEGYLSPNLQNAAARTAGLFATTDMLDDRKREKDLADQKELYSYRSKDNTQLGLMEMLLRSKEPRMQQMGLQIGKEMGAIPEGVDIESITTKPRMPSLESSENRGVEGTMLDQIAAEAERLEARGATSEQAFKTAREAFDAKQKQLSRQYERVEDSAKVADEIRSLVGQSRIALGKAGYTGTGGEAMQTLSSMLGLVNADQKTKQTGGQDVRSLANKSVETFGRAFKGPMSDNDVKIMLRAAPSLTNTPEANEDILNRWEVAAAMQQSYTNFMRDRQEAGMPVNQAEKEWSTIKQKNPYVVLGENGYQFNPFWAKGGLQISESGTSSTSSEGLPDPTKYQLTGKVGKNGYPEVIELSSGKRGEWRP